MGQERLKEPIELFGYECGDGWLPLVNEAKGVIDEWNTANPDAPEPMQFVQVKEKWGELCLYCNFYPTKEIMEKIREIEQKSTKFCELCGTTKDVSTEWTHGWVMTLCKECREAETKAYSERLNRDS